MITSLLLHQTYIPSHLVQFNRIFFSVYYIRLYIPHNRNLIYLLVSLLLFISAPELKALDAMLGGPHYR